MNGNLTKREHEQFQRKLNVSRHKALHISSEKEAIQLL